VNKFSIIVACDNKNGIGKDNTIPWYSPADMEFFKQTTRGGIVIMGRKTFSSIGKPLPGRSNIVITGAVYPSSDNPYYVGSLDQALHLAKLKNNVKSSPGEHLVWVIGGQQVYNEAVKHPDCVAIYLSRISGDYDCDKHFTNPFELSLLGYQDPMLWVWQEDLTVYRYKRKANVL